MSGYTDLDQSVFDLGFAAGADLGEDLPVIEVQSRVLRWQIGFVLGRSFAETTKAGNFNAYAITVGRLGEVYDIDVDTLLAALVLTDEQRDEVRRIHAPK